jgi:hypothetical protein
MIVRHVQKLSFAGPRQVRHAGKAKGVAFVAGFRRRAGRYVQETTAARGDPHIGCPALRQ